MAPEIGHGTDARSRARCRSARNPGPRWERAQSISSVPPHTPPVFFSPHHMPAADLGGFIVSDEDASESDEQSVGEAEPEAGTPSPSSQGGHQRVCTSDDAAAGSKRARLADRRWTVVWSSSGGSGDDQDSDLHAGADKADERDRPSRRRLRQRGTPVGPSTARRPVRSAAKQRRPQATQIMARARARWQERVHGATSSSSEGGSGDQGRHGVVVITDSDRETVPGQGERSSCSGARGLADEGRGSPRATGPSTGTSPSQRVQRCVVLALYRPLQAAAGDGCAGCRAQGPLAWAPLAARATVEGGGLSVACALASGPLGPVGEHSEADRILCWCWSRRPSRFLTVQREQGSRRRALPAHPVPVLRGVL